MSPVLVRAALLLFGSGFCALVYQTAWLRSLRLVFGASTAASAAVLAIFMAGLGFGGLILGRRADRQRDPLRFYALLEAGISIGAGLSPWLVLLVQKSYIALGGSEALGPVGGSAVRLLLSVLVLGGPTFLMGGTLPAMARAVEEASDPGRRATGLLYAVNTLGAVAGALITTFWALEILGIQRTVWVAALLNLLVAVRAWSMSQRVEPAPEAPVAVAAPVPEVEETSEPTGLPGWFVPVAAAGVGFAFLLMELVWYRMLAPLLGGSSYTFGLILAVALLGIGVGGLLYGAGPLRRRPTLAGFAATCSLEALALALPLALGDRLAVLAALLRPFAGAGFLPLVLGWTVVTTIVVLPAAIVAGYQFPLLIALLGSGRKQVGREIGVTYASNTVGAIAGSIAGGFGLIPLLSAPGVWRLVAALLLILALVAVLLDLRTGSGWRPATVPILLAVVAALFAAAPGPTAFWRHSPIGAGRVDSRWSGPNEVRNLMETRRRTVVWERDGIESSVALDIGQEVAFLVNGKADGSARSDAPTQIMGGLVGSMLHPDPKRSLVIGLGTGSTAGWLAAVPSMERVDVVELEPTVVRVAEILSAVNHDALNNPKINLSFGDGRELLLTTSETYDVIFSEPSNPYRAGIASLFSEDFYHAVHDRLRPGGIFLQWLQGYELDAQVVSTVYATLGAAFPSVETWEINAGDLLLVATREPLVHDLDRVRTRAGQSPYREALLRTWGVGGVAGFYSGYIASPAFGRSVQQREGTWINTDDRPVLEFGFARNLGRTGLFKVEDMVSLVRLRGEHLPASRGAALDWGLVDELRDARRLLWRQAGPAGQARDARHPERELRRLAREAYSRLDLPGACGNWFAQPMPPFSHADLLLVAECLAGAGDPRAQEYAGHIRAEGQPVEADLILGIWHHSSRRGAEAGRHLAAAFQQAQKDPWPHLGLLERGLRLANQVAHRDVSTSAPLEAAISRPFAVGMVEHARLRLRFELSDLMGKRCVEAFEPYEGHLLWEERFLALRARCYREAGDPRAVQALNDLGEYLAEAPPKLEAGLPPPQAPPARQATP